MPWLPWHCGTATAFNLNITVGNIAIHDVGDIQISRSISNLGLSGISVTSLSFKCSDFPTVSSDIPIYMGNVIGNLPTFFINSDVYRDGVDYVEALDRCAYLDVPIDTAPNDEPWDKTADNQYNTSAFRAALIDQCGFSSVELPYTKATIPCERIDGKTFQTVLNEMAQAYCGFFCCHSGTSLSFIQYRADSSVTETITECSRLHTGGGFSYNAVIATDGKNYVKYGGNSAPTLTINSEYVDTEDLNMPYYEVSRGSWSGWSVDYAISPSCNMPILGDRLRISLSDYASTVERVLRATARVVGDKLLLSIGCDVPNGGFISRRGLMQQKLDDAVSTAKLYGTVKIINSGISLVANDRDVMPS